MIIFLKNYKKVNEIYLNKRIIYKYNKKYRFMIIIN